MAFEFDRDGQKVKEPGEEARVNAVVVKSEFAKRGKPVCCRLVCLIQKLEGAEGRR